MRNLFTRVVTAALLAILMFAFLLLPTPAEATSVDPPATICLTDAFSRFIGGGTQTAAVDIPAGDYTMTIVTSDAYRGRKFTPARFQSSESVEILGVTTSDLDDEKDSASKTTVAPVSFTEDQTSLTVTHNNVRFHPDSVEVPSVCFEPVAPQFPEVEIVFNELCNGEDVLVSADALGETSSVTYFINGVEVPTLRVGVTTGDTIALKATQNINGFVNEVYEEHVVAIECISDAPGEIFVSFGCDPNTRVISANYVVNDDFTDVTITVNGEQVTDLGEVAVGDVIFISATNGNSEASTTEVVVKDYCPVVAPDPVDYQAEIILECNVATGFTTVTVVPSPDADYTNIYRNGGAINSPFLAAEGDRILVETVADNVGYSQVLFIDGSCEAPTSVTTPQIPEFAPVVPTTVAPVTATTTVAVPETTEPEVHQETTAQEVDELAWTGSNAALPLVIVAGLLIVAGAGLTQYRNRT